MVRSTTKVDNEAKRPTFRRAGFKAAGFLLEGDLPVLPVDGCDVKIDLLINGAVTVAAGLAGESRLARLGSVAESASFKRGVAVAWRLRSTGRAGREGGGTGLEPVSKTTSGKRGMATTRDWADETPGWFLKNTVRL